MISILREAIHAFLSIVLHDYYEKIDQTDLSFFYENHSREKYHFRKVKDQEPFCAYILIFFECSV
jgi:hypothetical protein